MPAASTYILKTISTYSRELLNFIRGRVSRTEDAEDILQDVWFQLTKLSDVNEIEQISALLYRVARNKIIDRSRKHTETSLTDLSFEDEEFDEGFELPSLMMIEGEDPESQLLKETFWNELFTSLDELPVNQRQTFIWNELEDKTLRQIAEETGENLKTIISRKGYAVRHLRKKLDSLYQDFLNY